MRENIKILTENCCDRLLGFEADQLLREEYFKDQFDPLHLEILNTPTQYKIDNTIELDPENDFKSSRIIFDELGNLSLTQANDRRLWVHLTHSRFFKYTKKRWNIGSDSSNNAILDRFHFEGAGLSTRMRNSISRLWWAAKVTYDANRTNPYELTELIWRKQDLFMNLVERSYGTYPSVIYGFLEFYKEHPDLNDNILRMLYKGLNAMGGVLVLNLLTSDKIKEELSKLLRFYSTRDT